MKRSLQRLLVIGLLVSWTLCSFVILHPPLSQGYPAIIRHDYPVEYPLSTVPEPVLVNGTLKVEIGAGPEAGNWTAKLISNYGSTFLVLLNESYIEDDGWTIFFRIPSNLHPGLYSLNIAYESGEELINCTQPRSVWLLERWPEELTINHISDTHLPYGADLFATFAYETNLIHPDLIIHTGDVVDTETIYSAWTYLHRVLGRLRVPTYLLPGNHDYKGAGASIYKSQCGLLNYSIVIGNFLFIALDSTDAGFVALSQLKWAERILQQYSDKVKILGFHYPLFSRWPGGNITGSWKNVEILNNYLYYSWRTHLNETRELLRLVEEYDVRLILTGHIHRDIVYVYNNRHYFVTTVACGGSLPEGYYPGYRLIEVDAEGNVNFDAYMERRLFNPPNAIPVGHLTYYYRSFNDGTEPAVSATIINDQEQNLTDVVLEFYVSKEYDVKDYEFNITTSTTPLVSSIQDNDNVTFDDPKSSTALPRLVYYRTLMTEKGYCFITHVDMPPKTFLHLTLAAVEDEDPPSIDIKVKGEIKAETPLTLLVKVSDKGWGIRDVGGAYLTTDGVTNIYPLPPLEPTLRINKDEYIIEYPTLEVEVTIPGQPAGVTLSVTIATRDYAGHKVTRQFNYTIGPPAHTLNITSSPISGVPFTLDGEEHTTPYLATLEEGNHSLTISTEFTVEGTSYEFVQWEDGVTTPTRTIELMEDIALTIQYREVPPPKPRITPWQISATTAVIVTIVIVVLLRAKRRP
ncbi:hypothetical protein CW700_04180 [Candidatus Bathyarchaeota archaeon]|nr:MAG: hypothetical protein CW700_04180 [Candidatus Bathyarchaeota archaeon]